MTQDQYLYTLVVTGSVRAEISSPWNPTISHRGGTSVGHMVLKEEELRDIREQAEKAGLQLSITRMLGQTAEQTAERTALVTGEDRVWPCLSCVSCPWVDPIGEDSCGHRGWAAETIQTLVETQPSYATAWGECPLRRAL